MFVYLKPAGTCRSRQREMRSFHHPLHAKCRVERGSGNEGPARRWRGGFPPFRIPTRRHIMWHIRVHRGVPTFVRRSCPLSVSCMVHGRSRRGGAQDPRRRFRHARSCTTGRSRAWCPRRRRAPSSFTMPGDDGRLEPRSSECSARALEPHSQNVRKWTLHLARLS